MSSPSSKLQNRFTERTSFDIRGTRIVSGDVNSLEENLIAIGADVRRETGNDVFSTDPQLNEWMQRVKNLGGTSSTDDDERSKRLEEVPSLANLTK